MPPFPVRRGRNAIEWIITALSGPVGFFIPFYLEHAYEPDHSGAISSSLTFGILGFLMTDQLIERLSAYQEREEAINRTAAIETLLRTSGASMRRIEAMLLASRDERIFACIEGMSEAYFVAATLAARPKFGAFYEHRLDRLLSFADWTSLANQKIVYADPVEELPIAKQMIELAERTVDAIAVPNDMKYLSSRTANVSLKAQARLIRKGRTIRRIFVYDERNSDAPFPDILAIARAQASAGVQTRIYDGDDDASLPTPDHVIDLNIVDREIVRQAPDARLQLEGGLMTGVVLSERVEDLETASAYFERLWDAAYPLEEHPLARQAGMENEEVIDRSGKIDALADMKGTVSDEI